MAPILEYVIEIHETNKLRGVLCLCDKARQSRLFDFPGLSLGQEVAVDAHLVICCRGHRDDQFGVRHGLVRPFFHIDLHFVGCTQTLRLSPHYEAKLTL